MKKSSEQMANEIDCELCRLHGKLEELLVLFPPCSAGRRLFAPTHERRRLLSAEDKLIEVSALVRTFMDPAIRDQTVWPVFEDSNGPYTPIEDIEE